jgi:hypothetical protein
MDFIGGMTIRPAATSATIVSTGNNSRSATNLISAVISPARAAKIGWSSVKKLLSSRKISCEYSYHPLRRGAAWLFSQAVNYPVVK